jgi:hypothetical protein
VRHLCTSIHVYRIQFEKVIVDLSRLWLFLTLLRVFCSDEFVSKAVAFHIAAEIEPGSAIYGLWLLHRITEDNSAYAMTTALNEAWVEHSKTNRSLDYIPWRCWTLYSIAMCIARKFVQDGSCRGWYVSLLFCLRCQLIA